MSIPGSGSLPRSDGDPDDGLRVRSGSGGTSAVLADLEVAAAQLSRTAQDLADLAAETFRMLGDTHLWGSVVLSPVTGVAAEAAMVELAVGGRGLGALATGVGGLGLALESAAQLYRGADALACSLLDRVVLEMVGAGAPVLVGVAGTAVATGHGSDLVRILGAVPGSGDRVVGAIPRVVAQRLPGAVGLAAPGSPQEVAQVVSVIAGAGGVLAETGAVQVAVGRAVPGRAPSGVGAVAARVASCAQESPATVRVERVDGPDGVRAWIVEIPGTQDWSPTSANPLDATSAVATAAGYTSAASMLVATSLARSGVRPGEPVMLVGHSLGGMAAMQVAADPKLRAGVSVTHVMSMGSPIAAVDMPSQVKVLSLEHDDDPVPWLDGAVNPDRPNWVTAHGESVSTASGHGIEQYVRTAQLVDGSTDPSVLAWRSGTDVFFDRPGASATSWAVSGLRAGDSGGVAMGLRNRL